MALYVGGSEKQKIILDNLIYKLNANPVTSSVSSIRLLSSDDYILTDTQGVYLVAKEAK